MKITGHKTTESFKKYVRLTSEDAAVLMLEKESVKIEQSNVVISTTVANHGNVAEDTDCLVDKKITFDALLDTQFLASKINKAAALKSKVGYLKDGKLCSYDNEVKNLANEIEQFAQSSTSDFDVAKKYAKQLSVWKQSDLKDGFKELIIKCIKIDLSENAVMLFLEKALKMGILDHDSFANVSEIAKAVLEARSRDLK